MESSETPLVTDEMRFTEIALIGVVARALALRTTGKQQGILRAEIKEAAPEVHDALIALILSLRALMRDDEGAAAIVRRHSETIAQLLQRRRAA
jgi:hypothetical protein